MKMQSEMEQHHLNLLGKMVDCSRLRIVVEQIPMGTRQLVRWIGWSISQRMAGWDLGLAPTETMQLESFVEHSKLQRKVEPVLVLRIATGMT